MPGWAGPEWAVAAIVDPVAAAMKSTAATTSGPVRVTAPGPMGSVDYGVRVHVTVAGGLLVPLQAPLKPKTMDCAGWMTALHDSGTTVTFAPVWVRMPPQIWVMVCPFGKAQVTVQLVVGVVPLLVTRTSALKPPGHSLTFVYVAEQPLPPYPWS